MSCLSDGSDDRQENQQGRSSEDDDMFLDEADAHSIPTSSVGAAIASNTTPAAPVLAQLNVRTDEVIPTLPRAFDSGVHVKYLELWPFFMSYIGLAKNYVPHHENPRFRLTSGESLQLIHFKLLIERMLLAQKRYHVPRTLLLTT